MSQGGEGIRQRVYAGVVPARPGQGVRTSPVFNTALIPPHELFNDDVPQEDAPLHVYDDTIPTLNEPVPDHPQIPRPLPYFESEFEDMDDPPQQHRPVRKMVEMTPELFALVLEGHLAKMMRQEKEEEQAKAKKAYEFFVTGNWNEAFEDFKKVVEADKKVYATFELPDGSLVEQELTDELAYSDDDDVYNVSHFDSQEEAKSPPGEKTNEDTTH